jgi:hypothetical protein
LLDSDTHEKLEKGVKVAAFGVEGGEVSVEGNKGEEL